jgi:hypothetical protein
MHLQVEMVSGNLTLNQGSQSWWTFLRDNFSASEGCGSLDGLFAITVSEETPRKTFVFVAYLKGDYFTTIQKD